MTSGLFRSFWFPNFWDFRRLDFHPGICWTVPPGDVARSAPSQHWTVVWRRPMSRWRWMPAERMEDPNTQKLFLKPWRHICHMPWSFEKLFCSALFWGNDLLPLTCLVPGEFSEGDAAWPNGNSSTRHVFLCEVTKGFDEGSWLRLPNGSYLQLGMKVGRRQKNEDTTQFFNQQDVVLKHR